MTVPSVLNILFADVWYLIPLATIFLFLTSNWFKGLAGEFMVNLSVNILLDRKKYHLLKNVTLLTESGSTQIDHVIVSEYGVFVIETKNIKGWIFGNPSQKLWTQRIYRSSKKFQNPLHQNHKHVIALKSLLSLTRTQLHSIIVFVGDSTFKTQMPPNVTCGLGFIRYIKKKQLTVLSNTQVKEIVNKIQTNRISASIKSNRQHVKHVKKIISDKKRTDKKICSSCGNPMVLRKATRGRNTGKPFWGCSEFPKCNNTHNIT